jgi:hypothetical protein
VSFAKKLLAFAGFVTIADTGKAVHVISERPDKKKRLKPHDSLRGYYKKLKHVETGK